MKCPRCDGDKVVLTGPVVSGLAMTKVCPECKGTGEVEAKKDHTHFEPTDLRK